MKEVAQRAERKAQRDNKKQRHHSDDDETMDDIEIKREKPDDDIEIKGEKKPQRKVKKQKVQDEAATSQADDKYKNLFEYVWEQVVIDEAHKLRGLDRGENSRQKPNKYAAAVYKLEYYWWTLFLVVFISFCFLLFIFFCWSD